MTDPISITTGVVGLAAFAIQSSKALYDAIEKIKNKGRSVRELKEEINSLVGVLNSLKDTCAQTGVASPALQAPLLRCGRLCEDFTALVGRCVEHADHGRFSVRDFVTYTYKSKDIGELRSLLAAYKSTIAIALADANIRQVHVTAQLLQEYKQTIHETTSDLRELLPRFEEETASTSPAQETSAGQIGELERTDIAEERRSIETCLAICARVWKHIDEVYKESFLPSTSERAHDCGNDGTMNTSGRASRITSRRLEDCKTEIGLTAADLRLRLEEASHQLAKISRQPHNGASGSGETNGSTGTQEDFDSIRECLSICHEATERVMNDRVNVFEDVNMAEDGDQVIVSTFGDLISAKRVTAGARSTQLLGQMTDTSLQHISRTHAARRTEGSPAETASTIKDDDTTGRSQFGGRYGTGQKLSR